MKGQFLSLVRFRSIPPLLISSQPGLCAFFNLKRKIDGASQLTPVGRSGVGICITIASAPFVMCRRAALLEILGNR
jgi:hypothetical protein